MSNLDRVVDEMLAASDEARKEAEYRFIEALTFSACDEILRMLDRVIGQEFLALPVWARNLAYRLACLLEPENRDVLRRAAADLRCVGPDWDPIADELEGRARALETKT